MVKSLFFTRRKNARKNWNDIFNVLKELKKTNLSTQKSVFGKIIPQMNEKIRFLDKQKVRESVTSRSDKRSHSD